LTGEKTKSEDDNNQALKKMFDSWIETMNWIQNRTPGIPAVGPAAGLARNSVTINAELAQATESFAEFNKHLAQYYAKISAAWIEATRQVMAKCPMDMDISDEKAREAVKNVWIETFEQEFTTLFDSEDFAQVFGQMLKNEVKFNKHIRNLVEVISTNIGMPTRSEMDSVYKEIERIKNKLKEMSDNIRDLSKIRKETARVSR